MKKVKKTISVCLFMLGLFLAAEKGSAQTISSHLFGVNAWMPDTIGDANNCQDPPCIRRGKLHQNWKKVKDSKAVMVRYGGIGPDKNMPTNYQYIRMIDSIRANGMEPVIQVPYYNGRYTAQQAANIVQYINVTKGRNVKYWIIGNEPNLSYSYTTAAQIAAYFKPFASAMKNVDPTILIVGPETASFKQTMITDLTTPGGPSDITGKDAAGRYYLDVFTFHTYPMQTGTSSRAQVISKLTDPGSFQDDLGYLGTRLANCDAFHNRTGSSTLKMAVTEANVNYTNSPSDDLYGVGANSFLGGQFVAEMFGIAMKKGVDFINLWSVIEGSNSIMDNCGYIDPLTGNKKPIYYHFKMMAENFKGSSKNCTSNQLNVKTFGCKSSQEITVMLMNEELTTNFNYTVRLNTGAVSGTNPLKLTIDAGLALEHSGTISAQSTLILTFNSSGALIRKTEYSLMDQAVANLAPLVMQYGATGISDVNGPGSGIFEMNVFPNPTEGKFTIALSRGPAEDKDFEIELINLLGQQVYHKKSEFRDGKEEIMLEDGTAQGVYILNVKQGEMITTKKLMLNK
ncbi:MAG: T9SS type A sorting domain-containing protein [Bacteroidia bacterium]